MRSTLGRMSRFILRVQCEDRPGLVADVAAAIASAGANILDAHQHMEDMTPPLEAAAEGKASDSRAWFFQRILVEAGGDSADKLAEKLQALSSTLGLQVDIRPVAEKKRIALFVSRYSHCLVDLLWRHKVEELRAEIPLIVSNHPDLAYIAEQFGIAYHHLPVTPETQLAQEDKALALLTEAKVDLVVLARYMRVLRKPMIEAYQGRIINIHHSFLPAFAGGKPYHQAAERGVKLIGATAHYATEDLDEGPIIEQDVVRASHRDTVKDLVRKGRDLEKIVLARAVRWHLEDRIMLAGQRTVVFD